jgi:hypothetical protein
MGSHNHLLQLGGPVYLEIVALDPEGARPPRPRWFGLDDAAAVRRAWEDGRRLRGWVARTDGIDAVLAERGAVFGRKVSLPWTEPSFDFVLPDDGSLPWDGAAPSLIDRRGRPRSMASIADLGARLRGFALEHPESDAVAALYRELAVVDPPTVVRGAACRYRAQIETAQGMRELW